ncbi:MAG: regulatory protein RecX [Thermodesulfobacteriota bacterium]
MKRDWDDLTEAKGVALTYIAYRSRSIGEVREKLKRKGFDTSTIDEAIVRLTELGYLNDRRFAEEWVDSIARSKRWGKRRIVQGLIARGIERGIIEEAVKGFDGEREAALARSALQAWYGKLPRRGREPLKQRSSAYRHLTRRGFSSETVLAVMDEVLKGKGSDEG